ncbi:hypothetical protein GPK34_00430 [Secundilactobacillus kimchicus]|uniref:hypothetical protein n=1 Tax=Secundilactobacillus kimchicus TaxID=528209 RepID=UPI001C0199EA|nr:hypothetical protein [Secundilactobacillus kimchicus]MBT9670503.1 hypothetical protein [Secundilactobacillus kimchicus]
MTVTFATVVYGLGAIIELLLTIGSKKPAFGILMTFWFALSAVIAQPSNPTNNFQSLAISTHTSIFVLMGIEAVSVVAMWAIVIVGRRLIHKSWDSKIITIRILTILLIFAAIFTPWTAGYQWMPEIVGPVVVTTFAIYVTYLDRH